MTHSTRNAPLSQLADDFVAGVAPYFPEHDRREIMAAVGEILASGQLTQGRYLREFEQACAEMAGTRHALGVNSGGAALQLVLEALDVRGGEVIVPTDTFVATPNSVVRAGGTPVFVDVSADSLTMNPEAVARAITPRTRAVIMVHMFGIIGRQVADIQCICRGAGIALVEDAAHAHGASYDGHPAGSLGLAGCFSYYATKILTTGEGGAVTTDDGGLASAVRSLRDHGRTANADLFDRAGNNFRFPELLALLGTYQHRRLAEIVAHRRAVAAVYRDILSSSTAIALIDPEPRAGHVYWRYPVLLHRSVDRTRVQAEMAEQAACRVTWMYEPLCHQQPYYAASGAASRFLVAEDVMTRLVNLPTHPAVGLETSARIAHTLTEVVKRALA